MIDKPVIRTDRVRLEIPASAEYVVLARLAISGIGSRIGFSYDDVEDLKVIAGEVCRLLVGDDGQPPGGTIAIEYSIEGDHLALVATARDVTAPEHPDELSLALLEALTDECEVSEGGDRNVRVLKRIPS